MAAAGAADAILGGAAALGIEVTADEGSAVYRARLRRSDVARLVAAPGATTASLPLRDAGGADVGCSSDMVWARRIDTVETQYFECMPRREQRVGS